MLAIFRQDRKGQIVGGKVIEGSARDGVKLRVLRNEEVVSTGVVRELQAEKKKVAEVKAGRECGLRRGRPVHSG